MNPVRNELHRSTARDCRRRPLPARGQRPDRRRGGRLSPGRHSDFAALRARAGAGQASFVAFDLLSLEANDLRQRPLEERREALARLVAGVDGIRFSAALTIEGATVFAHACKLGLEGVVSRRVGSRYRSGASRNWLKCLNSEFQRG